MASAFSDCLIASGGGGLKHPPEISKTTKGTTINFYKMLVPLWRHKIKKNSDVSGLVFTLQTEIPKIPIYENAFSSYANFTILCRVVHKDVGIVPGKFQIDISNVVSSISRH